MVDAARGSVVVVVSLSKDSVTTVADSVFKSVIVSNVVVEVIGIEVVEVVVVVEEEEEEIGVKGVVILRGEGKKDWYIFGALYNLIIN